MAKHPWDNMERENSIVCLISPLNERMQGEMTINEMEITIKNKCERRGNKPNECFAC